MNRRRIAFVFSTDSSFVEIDRRLLSHTYTVRPVHWRGKRSIPSLVGAVARSDLVFAWFALDHAYGACRLARLFGRKSVVVVGGVDAAKVPELEYGVHLHPKQRGKLTGTPGSFGATSRRYRRVSTSTDSGRTADRARTSSRSAPSTK